MPSPSATSRRATSMSPAKGLGISIRALLDLVEDAARRATDEGRRALSETLRRFCGDIEELACCAEDTEPTDPGGWLARTRRRLAEAEVHFDREHRSLAQQILEALDRRDGAVARELVDQKELSEFVPLHDRLVRFMAEVWAWVLEHLGAEELRRFHLAAAEAQRRGFEAWERLPAEGFARATAFLVRQHMGDTTILEDDEKFRFVLSPCGSGGRLRLGGAYEGPERASARGRHEPADVRQAEAAGVLLTLPDVELRGVRGVVRTPAMGVPRSVAHRRIVHDEHL